VPTAAESNSRKHDRTLTTKRLPRCSSKVQQPRRRRSALYDPHPLDDQRKRAATTTLPLDGKERNPMLQSSGIHSRGPTS
jgi:hypothetical protein